MDREDHRGGVFGIGAVIGEHASEDGDLRGAARVRRRAALHGELRGVFRRIATDGDLGNSVSQWRVQREYRPQWLAVRTKARTQIDPAVLPALGLADPITLSVNVATGSPNGVRSARTNAVAAAIAPAGSTDALPEVV